ncbi:MAG: response regulator transcription factor [Candidatus Limnocylindria bacterium]
MGRMLAEYQVMVEHGGTDELRGLLAAGEEPEAILQRTPLYPHMREATERFEAALGLYEALGDRKGIMSSIIGLAYTSWGAEIRFGAAQRLEDMRRLWTRVRAFTTDSERAIADAQMLVGVEVFAYAKGSYDLAISRGEEAHRAAHALGDRGLEFLASGFAALAHVALGEPLEADRWLERAASAAAASPTPLRARRLESWRGQTRAAAGDAPGMRRHLEAAVERATEDGRPAARCEALADLALMAARLGRTQVDAELLELADGSAREAASLARLLPGHPPWGPRADAALGAVALARGDMEGAAAAAGSALEALHAAKQDDLDLALILTAAGTLLVAAPEDRVGGLRELLRQIAAIVAQRIVDDDVRARFFRAGLGRELVALAGTGEPGSGDRPEEPRPAGLSDQDLRLLRLMSEGRTNAELARELGVGTDEVARRLGALLRKLASSSRAEATAFAFRAGLM